MPQICNENLGIAKGVNPLDNKAGAEQQKGQQKALQQRVPFRSAADASCESLQTLHTCSLPVFLQSAGQISRGRIIAAARKTQVTPRAT